MPINPLVRSVLESTRPKYDAPLSVKGGFLFLSDIEIPFHNAAFINGCFTLAKRYGVRQAVYGGDWMHFEAFSPFPGADTDAETELAEIDEYLGGFLEPFDQITWLMGNHDDRPQRALNRKISNTKALRLILSDDTAALFHERVAMTEYYWCYADHGWQLEHQKNNSMIPSRVAQALSAKFQCHVITAHTHKAGSVIVNGKWAIDAGCAVDITKLAYPNLRHSTHTQMQNGAVLMLERGDHYFPIQILPQTMDDLLWQAKKQAK